MLDGMVEDTVAIYIYEYSHLEENTHTFMIGVDLPQDRLDEASFYLEPIGLKQLQEQSGNKAYRNRIPSDCVNYLNASIYALDREYKATYASVIVGGVFIFLACSFVAFWTTGHTKSENAFSPASGARYCGGYQTAKCT